MSSLSQYLLRATLAATLLPMLVLVSLSYGQYRDELASVERWAGQAPTVSASPQAGVPQAWRRPPPLARAGPPPDAVEAPDKAHQRFVNHRGGLAWLARRAA